MKPVPAKPTLPLAASTLLRDAKSGALKLSPEETAALELLAESHRTPLTVIGRIAGSGRMNRREVEASYNATRLMGRGAAKIILEMLFEKATLGEACGYDAETLRFLAKGFGIVAPSKPVDDTEREAAASVAASAATMSDAELAEHILAAVRETKDEARRDAKEE